jgi:hypothetical protein
MYSFQIAERVAKEQHEDRLRQAEYLRLTKLFQNQQVNRPKRVAGWVGSQMVAAGLKLQGHTPSPMIQDGAQKVICCPK